MKYRREHELRGVSMCLVYAHTSDLSTCPMDDMAEHGPRRRLLLHLFCEMIPINQHNPIIVAIYSVQNRTPRKVHGVDHLHHSPQIPPISVKVQRTNSNNKPHLVTMHNKILPAILSLINLSLTLALTPPNATNSSANTTLTPPSRYYLKTRVLDEANADKNDLYVSSYHTGASETPSPLPFHRPHTLQPHPFLTHPQAPVSATQLCFPSHLPATQSVSSTPRSSSLT